MHRHRPVRPEPGLKWHKFLIYFFLWVRAADILYTGYMELTGRSYGNPNEVYVTYPGLKIPDMAFGIAILALGVFTIYTRFQLARFKVGAPSKLTIIYVLDLVLSLLLVVTAINHIPFGDYMDKRLLPPLLGNVVTTVINIIYYNKRRHLFINV